MITGVKENGPYIVLTKHVALPHARPESGALESAIGIATLKTPVVFGNEANDPVKYLFCLSAKDNMEHLNARAELAVMLEDAQCHCLTGSKSWNTSVNRKRRKLICTKL